MAHIEPPQPILTAPARTRTRFAVALLSGALVLSGCQTLGEDVYESSVKPSSTPQTAEKAGASDPRTRIGANEHPRIIAT